MRLEEERREARKKKRESARRLEPLELTQRYW
jgi:hypothetical protein